jgi:predicted site-specific integrase-resolvase
MIKKLLTVKEYCKLNQITDAAARKHISSGKVVAVSFEDQAYIIVESNEINTIRIKLQVAREKIKTLQAEALLYTTQRDQIIKLENKIESLENKLEGQQESKERLYEKVIGQYDLLLPR